MSTSIDRQELAQLIREIIREDPSIVIDALREFSDPQTAAATGISEEDRQIADRIFTRYKNVLDALA